MEKQYPNQLDEKSYFIITNLKYLLSGQMGIEPILTILETVVLPLNYYPVLIQFYYSYL
jgi:hypothetical protein